MTLIGGIKVGQWLGGKIYTNNKMAGWGEMLRMFS